MNRLKKIFWLVMVSLSFQCLYVSAKDDPGKDEKYHAVKIWYENGVKYLTHRRFDSAVKIFSKVIDSIPIKAESNNIKDVETEDIRWLSIDCSAHFCRGVAYNGLEQYDKAIADFNYHIKSGTKFDEVYFSRGLSYLHLRQYDKAIADFSHVINLSPENDSAYTCRGDMYYDSMQYDKAILDFTHAIKINPNNDETYDSRGLAYYDSEQYDKAIADFSCAIKLNPDNDRYLYLRGRTYLALKQYDKALKDFSMAHGFDGYFGQAETYCLLKQYESAINCYVKAIEIAKTDKTGKDSKLIASYLNIMKICLDEGNPARFNYWLKQFEKNVPKNKLPPDDFMLKWYFVILNHYVINDPLENIEEQFCGLRKKNAASDCSFDLINELLVPTQELTPKTIREIQSLIKKIERQSGRHPVKSLGLSYKAGKPSLGSDPTTRYSSSL